MPFNRLLGQVLAYPKGLHLEIQIDPHTIERARERGTDEEQIREVIETGAVIPAKYGRSGRAKVFSFQKERLGKYFEQKRVEVYYKVEGETAITATVYVFYGKWED